MENHEDRSKPRLLILEHAIKPDSDAAKSLSSHFLLDFDADAAEIIGLMAQTSEADAPDVNGSDFVVLSAAMAERLKSDEIAHRNDFHAAQILKLVGQAVCLFDYDGRLIWSNESYKELPDSVRDRMASSCVAAGKALASNRKSPRLKVGRKIEFEDENETSYEMVVSPVIDPIDPTSGDKQIVGVVWDNSREKQLQRKIDAIDAAGSELVRIESETVASLNTAERLALLEDNIIKYTRDLLHFDHFNIYLLEENTNRLLPVMMVGMPAQVADYELYASSEGSGISGSVAATAQSYICPDVTKDARYLPGLEGAASSLSVPLRLHDKVVGVFNVESRNPNAFTEDDRQFAEIFGRYVALALNILDLLVVERCATSGTVAVNVIGEINQPLNDINTEAQKLRDRLIADPSTIQSLDRILALVENVRHRVRDVAQGPKSILGVQEELARSGIDPLFAACHVLVADDEANIRNTIANVLSKRGARVTVADTGARAIDVLEKAAPGNIGLVLSDISMPDRNGYEVFATARKQHANVPVILMTGFGYDPHHSIVRASQEGLQCVLFKPFQIDQLLEEVTKALTATVSSSSSSSG